MSKAVLTKSGFVVDEWKDGEWVRRAVDVTRPRAFLRSWSRPFSVEPGVTTGDLLDLLLAIPEDDLAILGGLTNTNFLAYLDEMRAPPEPLDYELTAVEVHRFFEFGDQDEVPTLEYHTWCHGTTPPDEYGGTATALEFTPLCQLRSIPLVVRQETPLYETFWENTEPREFLGRVSTRGIRTTATRKVAFEPPSLGEFLQAVSDELFFFESPGYRDGRLGKLKETLDELKAEEGGSDDPGAKEEE